VPLAGGNREFSPTSPKEGHFLKIGRRSSSVEHAGFGEKSGIGGKKK
jgi:hypothetical protein